ncbi:fungal-specific transcription factor domain-containing protein [Thelonectria olida]|uniref:Fungal-specific transcription factor domain-containing protein n=1 Tax=Thelonectria olida TaxID=1576542 RepID=A0A9P8VQ94_9HYPO|nr:fungal-specific transcription factor domain-containing protein [Thelonectria olida]
MWVHPLYPLIRLETLRRLVERCSSFQGAGNVDRGQTTEKNTEMAIFYLVMALGAINQANTVKQMRLHPEPGNIHSLPAKKQSPAYLYFRALHHFDSSIQHLRPSVATIQIVLLISIYSSYGPIGSSQWQLAGLAMRMATEIGLHYSPKVWHATEQERNERGCVFWTAYAIEMSLAYNLGRPPSIGEEHITTALPVTSDALLAVHYVKHRQIQSKIISQIYCGNNNIAGQMSMDQKKSLISGLQAQLDEWRANIPTQTEEASAYPHSYWDRLYHGTSFVLHRSSPLCPHPVAQSLEKCVRSAGAYIDDMVKVLRNSNVPLSWMLVQGVLFAGLTMLITIRKGFQQLASQAGWPFLLVDFPAWTRKCSICLAIMNERWKEDLLSKLEAQFETLANDTLHIISSGLPSQPLGLQDYSASDQIQLANVLPSNTLFESNEFANQTAESGFSMAGDWEHFDMFREVLGLDTVQTFWNMFPAEPHDGSQHT